MSADLTAYRGLRDALPGKDSAGPALVAAVRQQRPPVEVTPLPFVPKRYRR